MAIQALKTLTFSGLGPPKTPLVISQNLARVSIWGTLGSSAALLASTIFNRFLAQESAWKPLASHVLEVSWYSQITFALFAVFCTVGVIKKNRAGSDFDKTLHQRVSILAIANAMTGWIGAAVAFASETPAGSFAKRFFYPCIGIGAAASVFWLFLNSQSKQLEVYIKENKK